MVVGDDNGDLRLSEVGYDIGLISEERFEGLEEKKEGIEGEKKGLY